MTEIRSVVTELYTRPQGANAKKDSAGGKELPPVQKDEVGVSLQNQSVDKEQKANEVEEAGVKEAVAQLNDYVQNMERKLQFQMDEDSGLTVIKVYDKQSDEIIRQIPSEEAVTLARNLNESEPLVLFSAQV